VRYGDLFHTSINRPEGREKQQALQVLIENAFNLTRTQFWIKKNDPIKNKTALNKFYRHRNRLFKGEPLAYIIKTREFYSRSFYVNKNVLIPRPETELLVEKALENLVKPASQNKILDIGAGSGNISITLALESNAHITATDNCSKALAVFKKNILLHQVAHRVTPVKANLFPPAHKGKKKTFHIIVSNPPYIPYAEWLTLKRGVKDFEPKNALVADSEGLALIRRIANLGKDYLFPGGKLLLEFGFGQKQGIESILQENGYREIQFFDDINTIPRVVRAVL